VTCPQRDLPYPAETLDQIDALLDVVIEQLSRVRDPRDLAPLYSMLKEVGVLFRSIDAEQ